jgi:hypothetical protein
MPRQKRPLLESDLNADSNPPKTTSGAGTSPTTENEPKYDLLSKPELQKECISRGLIKTGNKPDLVARLKSVDKAKRDKYANARNAPVSKEEAAKRPIGAKVPPSKGGLRFGKNDPLEKIKRRGPTGPPVYDEMGFELDYDKVANSGRRRRPGARSLKYEEMLDQEQREDDRKAEIMGTSRNKTSALTLMAWDDRVSRDLGIPYHAVDLDDFEEWYRRGFRAADGEFEAQNIPEHEQDRISNLATGSVFRK